MAWTSEEDAQLLQRFDQGAKVAQLATLHKRTAGAITSRLTKHGRLMVPDVGKDRA